MKTQLKIFFVLILVFVIISPNLYGLLHNPKPNPNPFRQGEQIEFKTDYDYERVELYIYNIKGDLIINKTKTSNFSETMKWNGKNKYGYYVSKGRYFYVLEITHTEDGETKTDTVKGSIIFIR